MRRRCIWSTHSCLGRGNWGTLPCTAVASAGRKEAAHNPAYFWLLLPGVCPEEGWGGWGGQMAAVSSLLAVWPPGLPIP